MKCSRSTGLMNQVYNITQQAENGGTPCEEKQDEKRDIITSNCAKVVNCTGQWVDSFCNRTTGLMNQVYNITQESQNGGTACEATQNQRRDISTSNCAKPINCTGQWVDSACNTLTGYMNQIL
jgi:glycerol-3-phosphate dehydrogenase